jgi:hypothetical protein
MGALFESEWNGQPDSNYGWSAVRLYEANGTDDGRPVGVVVDTFGDDAIPDADIPRLITALRGYLARDAAGEFTITWPSSWPADLRVKHFAGAGLAVQLAGVAIDVADHLAPGESITITRNRR